MERFTKTDLILETIDRGLVDAGPIESVEAVEDSVLAELSEDEKCGFITGDEKELIFRSWRNRYRADLGNVVHIRPISNITPPDIPA